MNGQPTSKDRHQRTLWRVGIGLALSLSALTACDPIDPTPELLGVQVAPTLKVYPSVTPTVTHITMIPFPTASQTLTLTPTATETPIPVGSVVIVVKPIPVGYPIPPQAVRAVDWPLHAIPYNALTDVHEVINKVALADLPCFEPIVRESIAYREAGTGYLDLPETCPALPEGGEVDVVVVVRSVNAGEQIHPGVLRLERRPYAPPDALTALADAIGKTALVPMLPEQVVTRTRIGP